MEKYYIPDINNLGLFNDIKKSYIIGDLHGDLKILLNFLKSINLITTFNEKIINDYDIYKEFRNQNLKPKKIIKKIFKLFDDNYFFTLSNKDYLINNFNNTCLIQLGDIMDTHNVINFYFKENNLINNDIFIYLIFAYIDIYFNKLNIENFNLILLVGNHDFEHIIKFLYPKNYNDIKDLINDGFDDWLNYILNYDEIYKKNDIITSIIDNKTRYDNIIYKFNFRYQIIKKLNIYKNTYLIAKINNNSYYSHTLLFFETINKLLDYKLKLYVFENNIISILNNIYFKIIWIYTKKNNDGLIKKKYFSQFLNKNLINISTNNKLIEILNINEIDNIINIIRTILNNRTNNTFKYCSYLDFFDFEDYKYHFIGHEIVDSLLKLDISELYYENIFNLANSSINIFYADIGLSSSINNLNLNIVPYYFYVEYNDDLVVYGCNNNYKAINNYNKLYYQKSNRKIVDLKKI